ncbi:MAG TPA: DMT family transporter [Stackebrandtia sp.]|jgi:drug/metabolite transporter (DMT)-like permease|uniref:DMT family transporter n=1 Tax=Stackebrandtia sp. TaxID=2023065 RepID=UPI002D487400|nr:DMT family transporter [Stackebrandtia sp.]HZE38730.1 DMT family transporter [Stackebrandtia sp.]
MPVRYAGAARIGGLALFWGSSFLWIKLGLRGFSPVQITALRLLLGAAVLLAILRWRGLRLPSGTRLWTHLAVAALFGNATPYLLFGIAERQVSSSTAGVINASAPLWTVLFTVAAYRSGRTVRRNAWSLGLGFLGVVLIFSPWRLGTELMSGGGAACLGAAVSYGISYVYIGHFLARRELGALPMAAGQLVCATAMVAAAVPFLGLRTPHWRADSLVAILILGVLGTGITYLLNYRVIADDGPTAASIVVYLLPVVSVLLGVLVLGEALRPQVVGGMVLVLVAARLRRTG